MSKPNISNDFQNKRVSTEGDIVMLPLLKNKNYFQLQKDSGMMHSLQKSQISGQAQGNIEISTEISLRKFLENRCSKLTIEIEQFKESNRRFQMECVNAQNIMTGCKRNEQVALEKLEKSQEVVDSQNSELQKLRNQLKNQKMQIQDKDTYIDELNLKIAEQLINIQEINDKYNENERENQETIQNLTEKMSQYRDEAMDYLNQLNLVEKERKIFAAGSLLKQQKGKKSVVSDQLIQQEILQQYEEKQEKLYKLQEELNQMKEKYQESEKLRKQFINRNQQLEKTVKNSQEEQQKTEKLLEEQKKQTNSYYQQKIANQEVYEKKIQQLSETIDEIQQEREDLRQQIQKINKKIAKKTNFSGNDVIVQMDSKPHLF